MLFEVVGAVLVSVWRRQEEPSCLLLWLVPPDWWSVVEAWLLTSRAARRQVVWVVVLSWA